MDNAATKVFNVSELSQRVKHLLEGEIGQVWVEGEISGYRPQTGPHHMYFDLKDEHAVINVCLFKGSQTQCKTLPENGKQVRLFGDLSSFAKTSRYQVICRAMEDAGQGRLHQAFEQLKKKLEAEGLFAKESKKRLPLLPCRIGMVTSPSGAALQDMLHVLERRYPNLHIRIAPARVQGQGAAEEIAQGIEKLNRLGDIDAMIIGRGGGSMEDLWAFNEEIVARAIFASNIPIISAVGHETDFTISDFVADLRAPTPSAAAELVIRPKEDFVNAFLRAEQRLQRAIHRRAEQKSQYLDTLNDKLWQTMESRIHRLHRQCIQTSQRLQQQSPHSQLKRMSDRLQQLSRKLEQSPQTILKRHTEQLQRLALSLDQQKTTTFHHCKQRLLRAESRLRAMNPTEVLTRGYSITRRKDGHVVRHCRDVHPGDELETLVADGHLISTLTQSKEKSS